MVAVTSSSWADEPPADLVKARLIADTTAVAPGQPFKVGVLLKITPGWHLYWINPGDGGVPTTVELKLPEGFTASALQYPTPSRFEDPGGLVSFGYSDSVMLVATITPPTTLASDNIAISAEANWLVCEKVCVPGDVKLQLALPVGPPAPNAPEQFEAWQKRMPVRQTPQLAGIVQSQAMESSVDQGTLTLIVNWKQSAPEKIEWFPPASTAVFFGETEITSEGNRTTIKAGFQRLAGQKASVSGLESVLAYASPHGRMGVSVPVNLDPQAQTGQSSIQSQLGR